MTERERWIVYPLLFFALGAALRDKFTKEVNTDGLHAKQITCEELLLIDPQNATQPLAALRPASVGNRRIGNLLLTDNSGQSLFGLVEDRLEMRQVICEGISVVDPQNKRRILAALTSVVGKANAPNSKPQPFGVLLLNNLQYSQILGLPSAPGGNQPQTRRLPLPDLTQPSAPPENGVENNAAE